MAEHENRNRYRRIRWIIDDEHIIFGPKRVYKPMTLRMAAIFIMVIAFILIALVGSETIKLEGISSTFAMLALFVAFLYGVQLNGIVREALPLLEERQNKIEKAISYAKGRMKE